MLSKTRLPLAILNVVCSIVRILCPATNTVRILLFPLPSSPLLGANADTHFSHTGFFHFKKGTYGRYGSIIAFHTYVGQDEPRHSHYDTTDGDLPLPRNLDSFNGVLGARDAIEASTKITNFVVAKTKWDEGVRQFLSDEVFALDEKVQPGNTQVDPDPLCANTLSLQEKPTYTSQELGKLSPFESIHGNLEGEYLDHANIATRLNLLENGSGDINGSKHVIGNWSLFSICIRRWFRCNWLEPASFSLGGFIRLCLILGMILCGLLLLWLRAETFRRSFRDFFISDIE